MAVISPYLNRFIQPDTIVPNPANLQNFNRYGYVLNNPVNFNDPDGHCAVKPGFKCPTNPKITTAFPVAIGLL
jgi:hypothetical protein